MQRRVLLKLGIASAAVLAGLGGTVALVQPGLREHQLTAGSRQVFDAVGRAILDGVLPAGPAEQRKAMAALLERVDSLVAGLPPHAQAELSQLLAALQSAPGRRLIGGLSSPWEEAPIQQVQQALQAMRVSSLSLRRQAYQALHDITGSAYFSDPATWSALGYPGPIKL
jgi:hypothetical protein